MNPRLDLGADLIARRFQVIGGLHLTPPAKTDRRISNC
jgi:hypothetical protein